MLSKMFQLYTTKRIYELGSPEIEKLSATLIFLIIIDLYLKYLNVYANVGDGSNRTITCKGIVEYYGYTFFSNNTLNPVEKIDEGVKNIPVEITVKYNLNQMLNPAQITRVYWPEVYQKNTLELKAFVTDKTFKEGLVSNILVETYENPRLLPNKNDPKRREISLSSYTDSISDEDLTKPFWAEYSEVQIFGTSFTSDDYRTEQVVKTSPLKCHLIID